MPNVRLDSHRCPTKAGYFEARAEPLGPLYPPRATPTRLVRRMDINPQIDLVVDLNTMDETGLPWAFLDRAPDPTLIRPGTVIVVGSGAVWSRAEVVDITGDVVHFRPIRSSTS